MKNYSTKEIATILGSLHASFGRNVTRLDEALESGQGAEEIVDFLKELDDLVLKIINDIRE